ncbi:hypothetical protein BU24DRAFT_153592 [Aaosphaeria arxii CBS 175.79]|uniref:Uncharacterized protein n=1 Tax=Aaosphaeria arxii CBS 175.79 TaxID=1450172 RepID=A0A6A5XW78_9PLEO|nr:uncharacterized protein BU24DRAFT_153592 [Aaosphaeria arxii CBS 175.79]KAF2017585.1 hypothetical protein BU24DRAFT_153592 [Aaosphaeria arxii CBS 175.79]
MEWWREWRRLSLDWQCWYSLVTAGTLAPLGGTGTLGGQSGQLCHAIIAGFSAHCSLLTGNCSLATAHWQLLTHRPISLTASHSPVLGIHIEQRLSANRKVDHPRLNQQSSIITVNPFFPSQAALRCPALWHAGYIPTPSLPLLFYKSPPSLPPSPHYLNNLTNAPCLL